MRSYGRSKRVGKENDANGTFYQIYVGKYLERKTCQTAIVTKKHGVDIICGDLQVEVKGIKSFHYRLKGSRRTKKGRIRKMSQTRHWKIDQTAACPETVTHYAFVLVEKNICNVPLIYLVSIDDIRKRINEYPDSQWVLFWVEWVWDHYIPELSYIPTGDRFD